MATFTEKDKAEGRRLVTTVKDYKFELGWLTLKRIAASEDAAHNGSHAELKQYAADCAIEFDALRGYRDVGKVFDRATRVAGASWSLHRELMGAPDPVAAVKEVVAAARAAGKRATVDFAREYRGAKPTRYPPPGQREVTQEEVEKAVRKNPGIVEKAIERSPEIRKAAAKAVMADSAAVEHGLRSSPTARANVQKAHRRMAEDDAEAAAVHRTPADDAHDEGVQFLNVASDLNRCQQLIEAAAQTIVRVGIKSDTQRQAVQVPIEAIVNAAALIASFLSGGGNLDDQLAELLKGK